MKNLDGRVALVTGASRGVGKGIAKGLGEAGVTVYVTGRTQKTKDGVKGTVQETADEVRRQGGKGVGIYCDHKNDEEVQKVFKRIEVESGKLDILVNNVWGGYEYMFNAQGEYIWERSFWEQPLEQWNSMFVPGVRAHYVSSQLAAQLMVNQKSGLIVNISFWAAQKYMSNVAYGVAKAATDKLSRDTAYELKPHNVAVVSLYPGLVRTERVMEVAEYLDLSNSESPQFPGRVVSALADDPNIMEKTGKVLVAAQLALDYGIKDVDGKQPKPLSIEKV